MKSKGFTLVEILIVIALALTFSVGFISLYRLGLLSGTKTSNQFQAQELAKEGIEAITAIRDQGGVDWDWTNTPSNTASNEYYQPSISGTFWILGSKLTASPPPTLPSPYAKYTRTVKIEAVQRAVGCGSNVCSIVLAGGTNDIGTRKITSIVTWNDETGPKTASISSYLTHWR